MCHPAFSIRLSRCDNGNTSLMRRQPNLPKNNTLLPLQQESLAATSQPTLKLQQRLRIRLENLIPQGTVPVH
jgi:hypothetical protein